MLAMNITPMLPSEIVMEELSRYSSVKEVRSMLQIDRSYAAYNTAFNWKSLMSKRYPEYYNILQKLNVLDFKSIMKITEILDTKLEQLEEKVDTHIEQVKDKVEVNIYRDYLPDSDNKKIKSLEVNPVYKLFVLLCQHNFIELVAIMLDKYDKDVLFCTARSLNVACVQGHLEIVQMIYDRSFNAPFNYALYFAARSGHVRIVEFLLLSNSDEREFLSPPCYKKRGFSREYSLRESERKSLECLLNLALKSGSVDLCKYLLFDNDVTRVGINKDRAYEDAGKYGLLVLITCLEPFLRREKHTKYQSFLQACVNGHVEIVTYFLENPEFITYVNICVGCERWPDEDDDFYLSRDESNAKESPIYYACCNGHLDVLKLLLSSPLYQVWGDFAEFFFSGIHQALWNAREDVVKYGFEYRAWEVSEIRKLLDEVMLYQKQVEILLSIKQIQDYLSQDNSNGFEFVKSLDRVPCELLARPHLKIVCTPEAGDEYWSEVFDYREPINQINLFLAQRIPCSNKYFVKYLRQCSRRVYNNIDYETYIHQLLDLMLGFSFDEELITLLFETGYMSVVKRLETEFKAPFQDYGAELMKAAYYEKSVALFAYLINLSVVPLSISVYVHSFGYHGDQGIPVSDRTDLQFFKVVLATPSYPKDDIMIVNNAINYKDIAMCELLLKSGKLISDLTNKETIKFIKYCSKKLIKCERPDLAELICEYL